MMKRILFLLIILFTLPFLGCQDKYQIAKDICSENNMTVITYDFLSASCGIKQGNIVVIEYDIFGNKKDGYILKRSNNVK